MPLLQRKTMNNNKKFYETWEQNVKDIKTLQDTHNKNILEEALKREEYMQNKYMADMENAILLNKQLNTHVAKKNNQLDF